MAPYRASAGGKVPENLEPRHHHACHDVDLIHHPLHSLDATGQHAHALPDLVRADASIEPHHTVPDIRKDGGTIRPGLPSAFILNRAQDPVIFRLRLCLDR